MSDLISRSELLKSFQRCYSGHLGMENSDFMMTFKSICKIINQQPTTYDIDKVVEELEKSSKWVNETNEYCDDDGNEYIQLSKAIEIVKQGAVSDDVCEWKIKDACYTSSIKHYDALPTSIVKTFTNCPYCGKKIKVV